MLNKNKKIVLDILRECYTKQINETLKHLTSDLILKNKEKFKDFDKGTTFVIDLINDDGIVVKRISQKSDIQPDSYAATKHSVSYDDLEKYFELA